MVARRSVHMTLTEAGGEIPIFFSLFLPRPPAGVMTGILAGATFISPEPEPSASRIVMVRMTGSALLDDSNRYMEPAPGVVSEDLAALGLVLPAAGRADSLIQHFLIEERNPEHVAPTVQVDLSAELDPAHL
jgi:hypothetical protein